MIATKSNQTWKPLYIYKLANAAGQDTILLWEVFQNLLTPPQSSNPIRSFILVCRDSAYTFSTAKLIVLNAPCTEEEFLVIIKSLKKASAPGQDGYSFIYYKKCATLLTPKLAQVYNHVLQGNTFPEEML